MFNSILKIYNNFVENKFITYDKKQIKLLEIFCETLTNYNKIRILTKLKKFNGIYVYGSVGIGKTFILNLFIRNIKKTKKYHFNHFMINLHAFINVKDKKGSMLENYIKEIAKETNILFIDELHIFNIVDALIIKKIFILFKKYKIFILISSNFKPSELYKDGLQRDDFLPFVIFLEENFKIINFQNTNDYRRKMLNQSKTYFTPINNQTIIEFNTLFYRFADRNQIHIKKIKTKSRIIRFEKCTSNIAFCTFQELCKVNLAHEDYLNIAKSFKLIFIRNIPQFTSSESDYCRRFISLIDMLYDQKCSVVLLADQPINKLCQIKSLDIEFERTSSRLYEMTIINSNTNNDKK